MIKLDKITKKYGNKTVFDKFDLTVEDGKITVVLGESGAGKTTLLNVIANLTEFEGSVQGVKNVSMVFQKDRLVPKLTVEDNIRLVSPDADVSAMLLAVGLSGTEKLYPKDLSAGMARRVAIIRAFSFDAPVVLMDEPLVNLDLALKFSLIEMIKDLREKYKKTVILVTHDVKEAAMLADRAIVLKNGKAIYDRTEKADRTEAALTDVLLANYEK